MPHDAVMTWPVAKRSPGPQDVALADVVAVEAGPLGQHVQDALDGERGLVGAEAAHRAGGRVVGVDGHRLDVDVGHPVGAAGVAGGALQHLGAHRGVRAGVADDARAHRGETPLGVAARACSRG